jgi:hypothetical protein
MSDRLPAIPLSVLWNFFSSAQKKICMSSLFFSSTPFLSCFPLYVEISLSINPQDMILGQIDLSSLIDFFGFLLPLLSLSLSGKSMKEVITWQAHWKQCSSSSDHIHGCKKLLLLATWLPHQ